MELGTKQGLGGRCTGSHLAQVLSTLPPGEWAELAGSGAGSGALGAGFLQELLHLHTAFAKARQLLREMGEVRVRRPFQHSRSRGHLYGHIRLAALDEQSIFSCVSSILRCS